MIRIGEENGFSNKLYYRYTCEACGFYSHWITYTFQDLIAGRNGPVVLLPEVSACLDEVRALLAGRRADCRANNSIYSVFQKAKKCPRCGHAPSWLPVQKRLRRSAEKYNARVPMLSEPEVVFCGRPPVETQDLIQTLCQINIQYKCGILEAISPPLFFCLNGGTLRRANDSFNSCMETNYGDNVITIENIVDVPLVTFYFRAQSGAEMRMRYEHRKFTFVVVNLPHRA